MRTWFTSPLHAKPGLRLGCSLALLAALAPGLTADPVETGAASAPPAPYRRLRETQLDYHGPADQPSQLAEVSLGWFGPTHTTNATASDMWCAATLALEDHAASLPSNQPPARIRWVTRWTDNPWGSGVAQLTRMVFQEQPVALVGSVDSAATHLAEQVVAKANLPLISPITTDPSITLAGVPWMFSCAPSDNAVAATLVHAALEHTGAASNTCALLTTTDHESRMTARAILQEFNRRQRPPAFRFDLPATTASLHAHRNALRAAAPHTVIIVAGPEDAARLARDLHQILPNREQYTVYGGPRLARSRFRELAGPEAEGVRVPLLAAVDPADPRTARFVERFTAQQGRAPGDEAFLTYDAVGLLAQTLQRSGPSRTALRQTLVDQAPWQGLAGSIRFDGTGQNTRTNLLLAEWRGHATVPLPPSQFPAVCESHRLPNP